jgi:hypothetical protein
MLRVTFDPNNYVNGHVDSFDEPKSPANSLTHSVSWLQACGQIAPRIIRASALSC